MKLVNEKENQLVFVDSPWLMRLIAKIFIVTGFILVITIVAAVGGIFLIIFGLVLFWFGNFKTTITCDRNTDRFSARTTIPFATSKLKECSLSEIAECTMGRETGESLIDQHRAAVHKNQVTFTSNRDYYFLVLTLKDGKRILLNNIKSTYQAQYEKHIKRINNFLQTGAQ